MEQSPSQEYERTESVDAIAHRRVHESLQARYDNIDTLISAEPRFELRGRVYEIRTPADYLVAFASLAVKAAEEVRDIERAADDYHGEKYAAKYVALTRAELELARLAAEFSSDKTLSQSGFDELHPSAVTLVRNASERFYKLYPESANEQ